MSVYIGTFEKDSYRFLRQIFRDNILVYNFISFSYCGQETERGTRIGREVRRKKKRKEMKMQIKQKEMRTKKKDRKE